MTPNQEQKKSDEQQIAYPESTLATLPPIVRPAPKSTVPLTEHKTVGVIQAMFTISKTSTRPLTENDVLEEPTGKPLTDEDLHFEDLSNLIEDSPNWNKIGGAPREVSFSIGLKIELIKPNFLFAFLKSRVSHARS